MNDKNTPSTDDSRPAVGGLVEREVRPFAWRSIDGSIWNHKTNEDDQPLYDQAALDAALKLWPRDCRLCAHYTTNSGGCTSLVRCVDSMQFRATSPRQYWISGPNDQANLTKGAANDR